MVKSGRAESVCEVKTWVGRLKSPWSKDVFMKNPWGFSMGVVFLKVSKDKISSTICFGGLGIARDMAHVF